MRGCKPSLIDSIAAVVYIFHHHDETTLATPRNKMPFFLEDHVACEINSTKNLKGLKFHISEKTLEEIAWDPNNNKKQNKSQNKKNELR